MSVPTIKDVAAAAGVSTAAVSLYLNDRAGISQATRDRIAATIKALGYVPRANGRRGAGEGYVGMLVEELPLDAAWIAVRDRLSRAAAGSASDEET